MPRLSRLLPNRPHHANSTILYVRCWRCLPFTELPWSGAQLRPSCWKFGSKAPLKNLRNLSLRLRRGQWRFLNLTKGLGLNWNYRQCVREHLLKQTESSNNWARHHGDSGLLWGNSEGEEEIFLRQRIQCLLPSSNLSSGIPVSRCLHFSTLETMLQLTDLLQTEMWPP